jgi:Tol biopolymer transport system component
MTTGRREILLIAGLITWTLTVNAQVKDRGEILLQAAIKQELVEGDLKGAIEQFKTIAQNSRPEVAAEALVHLAACYDKLGQQTEARSTYERVVREHPNQKKAVAEARAWLDAHPTGPNPREGVRVEQVWTGKDASSAGQPSTDGRYVAFVDWTSGHGNLAVRDLTTGENRLLTRDAASDAWAAGPLVSPDGKQIAYRWEGGKDDSIRLIGLDGKRMRVLARREYGDFLRAWSPDGRQIAAIHYNYSSDQSVQMVLISAVDGSITSLKSTGWHEPTIGGFSPDGRFLVYSLPSDDAGNGAVFALAVDGSREIPLVQNSANNWGPVWSPDGSGVVFLSSRSGSSGLWSIRVVEGRPQGEPELRRANVVGTTPLAFTKDGSYYYRAGNVWRDAYTAELDPATLTISKPTLVTDRFVGSNSDPVLSPDGKYVAFLRHVVGRGPGAGQSLIVKSQANGDERTVAAAAVVSYGRLLWFPDSRSVIVLDRANNRPRFLAVDVETSAARTLFEVPFEVWNTAALSPDGKALFYTSAELLGSRAGPGDLKSLRLVRRQLDTGDETELHRTQSTGVGFFGLTVSSDGSKLAFSVNVADRKRALMVMPADGGSPREIYRTTVYDLSNNGAMIWTKDGKHLIVTARCGSGGHQLCAIPAEGGTLRPLGLGMLEITTRMISSDGRRLALTHQTRSPELWVIRNLLTETARAR